MSDTLYQVIYPQLKWKKKSIPSDRTPHDSIPEIFTLTGHMELRMMTEIGTKSHLITRIPLKLVK
jgi:hypothetical protein